MYKKNLLIKVLSQKETILIDCYLSPHIIMPAIFIQLMLRAMPNSKPLSSAKALNLPMAE